MSLSASGYLQLPTEPELFTKSSFSSPPASTLSLPPSSSPTPSSGDSTDSSSSSVRAKRRIFQLSSSGGAHRYSPYRTGRPNIMEALELRFTSRSLEAGSGSDITREDAIKGRNLFARGVRRLSDSALQQAMMLKFANRETRRHRAMASAWELKEAQHYSKLLEIVHHNHHEEYESSLKDDSVVEPEDLDSWDDTSSDVESLVKFNHEVYNEETIGYARSDSQYAQLEEEFHARGNRTVGDGGDEVLVVGDRDKEHD